MSINDLVVQGAEPLYFLDYFATSKLDLAISCQVITGVVNACKESFCELLGGETAEMPGIYHGDDYDLAGFGVGVVERSQLLPRPIHKGDVILGLPSSGLHSNGYSLVRYLIEKHGISYQSPCPFDTPSGNKSRTLAESLLIPTRLYVKTCVPLCKRGLIEGLAHITGGGLVDNIPRILGNNSTLLKEKRGGNAAVLLADRWEFKPVFRWLAKLGNVAKSEVARTWNCGIGMVVVVKKENVEEVIRSLKAINEEVYNIGYIASLEETGGKEVEIRNLDAWKLEY